MTGTRWCGRPGERWGERDYFEQQARDAFGSAADDEYVKWFVECQRFCASPGAAVSFVSQLRGDGPS